MATASYDPHLGAGPSEDSEILLDDSDSGSVLSEDSVLPDYETDDSNADPAKTLYEACIRNNRTALSRILERGITREEAMELDINGRVRGGGSYHFRRLQQPDDLEPEFCPFARTD